MTVHKGVEEPANILTVDFKAVHASVGVERQKYLRQLDEAWSYHGIVQVINHSIGTEMVDEAFEWCKKFFDLPREVKQTVGIPDDASITYEGWSGVGHALTSQGVWDPEEIDKMRKTNAIEQKEVMEIRDPCGTYPDIMMDYSQVEKHIPGFVGFLKKWFAASFEQSQEKMRLMCEFLGLESIEQSGQVFEPRHMSSHAAWNFFLSQPLSPLTNGSSLRLNPHTDYCQVTQLFQDMVGGLELHDFEADVYRPVPPVKGAMIVQVGDLLEKQNGRWRSALHRVTAPSQYMYGGGLRSEEDLVRRHSLTFFTMPNLDQIIEALPGCDKRGRWKSLEWKDRVTCGEWINVRVALEYDRKRAQNGK